MEFMDHKLWRQVLSIEIFADISEPQVLPNEIKDQ